MVHQELNQCLERNVIDNLFLGRYPINSMGVVEEGSMKKKAAELFRSWHDRQFDPADAEYVCLPAADGVRSPRQFPTMRR